MGYDVHRFKSAVDEELVCPICSGVLEDPLQAAACEHAFCKGCINEWISRQPTCPVDRQPVASGSLRPVPRITRNLLSRLDIVCENVLYGCNVVTKLDLLSSHLSDCEFNPKRPVPCELGCGVVIPKDEVKEHNCVKELRMLVQEKHDQLGLFEKEMSLQKHQIAELKRELALMKDLVRALRVSNPALRELADEMERDEVLRWSNSLPAARVHRWGGMISTPDETLQTVIRRALLESQCPPHIVEDLMTNCHERRWPPGLSSLETRHHNRRSYDSFICKRVPGKQAVVVLHVDNAHMNDDMIMEPGVVMIFAHGIESSSDS